MDFTTSGPVSVIFVSGNTGEGEVNRQTNKQTNKHPDVKEGMNVGQTETGQTITVALYI